MAEIAILLYAEAAGLSPGERLVIPKAARVQTDIAADRTHIAQDRRCHRRHRLAQYGITASNELRILDRAERHQRTDLGAVSRNGTDTPQFFNATDVEEILRRKQPLLHRWQQVGPAGDNLDVGRVLSKVADGVFNRAWA